MTPRFALRQRPDAAFETLYRRHVHEIYRYTLAVLGNPADAEDVTQTTFLNAYRAFHGGERPRKPSHWLRAIAHNVCRQRFRQAARRPLVVAELDDETVGAGAAADAAGWDSDSDEPSAADITRALQALPFNQRSALVMRELEGRRQAEIAEALSMSESAVEALLFRARRAMREQLESSISCGEAARAISRQLDRTLSREERASLRAHLRVCEECATFARQARAQRGALKALAAAPLPVALLTWGGGPGGAGFAGAAGAAKGGAAAGAATASGGAPATGFAGAAAAGSGGSGAAAAVGGGSLAAIGLKVAAGVVAVAVVAGGGEAVLHATGGHRAGGPRPAAAPSSSAPSPAATRARTRVAGAGRSPASHSGHAAGSAHAGPLSHRVAGHTRGHGKPHAAIVATPGHPGRAVRAHGTPTRAHGTPAPSNGNAVRAHGSPPTSHGTPTRAHGSPSTSNGTPTRSHGSPSNGGATHSHGTPPPQSNGTPTRAHGTPPKQDPQQP